MVLQRRNGQPMRSGCGGEDVVRAVEPAVKVVAGVQVQYGAGYVRRVGFGRERALEQGQLGRELGESPTGACAVDVVTAAVDGHGGFDVRVGTGDAPAERPAHANPEDAQPLGIDARLVGQQRQCAAGDERPVIPARIARRGCHLVSAGGLRHVAVLKFSPIGEFLATFPRAAEIVGDAGVAALGPVAHPIDRSRLSAAVDVQDAGARRGRGGRAGDGEYPHFTAIDLFGREAQFFEGNALLVPLPQRLDFQVQRGGIVALPQFGRRIDLGRRLATRRLTMKQDARDDKRPRRSEFSADHHSKTTIECIISLGTITSTPSAWRIRGSSMCSGSSVALLTPGTRQVTRMSCSGINSSRTGQVPRTLPAIRWCETCATHHNQRRTRSVRREPAQEIPGSPLGRRGSTKRRVSWSRPELRRRPA